MAIVITERHFPHDPAGLLPAVNADNAQYWEGLAAGELKVQKCDGCARPRYPIVPVCPYCTATDWSWIRLSGRGKIFSWVRYQRSYLPEFEDLVPYVVILAQLDEGVRMFGRLMDKLPDTTGVRINAPVETVIEKWPDGRCVPAFRLIGAKS